MQMEEILEQYPKTVKLNDGGKVTLRPLRPTDEKQFHQFFCAIPETERLLFKHRVTSASVIRQWCHRIDCGKILPLVALVGRKIVADASLHQTLGGWKRHVGRISVVVHPDSRGKGLAKIMVADLMHIARNVGLEKLEAEFMGEQEGARRVFGSLGFHELLKLPGYLKDMQALPHDYVLMGREILTDEEYAGTG